MSSNVVRTGASYLLETLVIALLYIAAAKLGFAIAPGNVTVVWPPSGIALAAVLVLGFRACLGIWWGAMLVNLMFFSQDPPLSTLALTKASGIATGSLCQAFLAAGLYRRVIGFGVPVAIKDIFNFVGIAALSCTVAATAGTTTLGVTGTIPWGDMAQTEWTWWLGDLAGILTLTPLLLLLGHGPPRERDVERLAFPAISMGCGLTLIAFYGVWQLGNQAVAARFERAAEAIASSLRQRVERSLQALESVADLHAASDAVDRDEFHRFVAPLLVRDPSLQAIAWVPRVPGTERDAYERAAREDGYPWFQITERDATGALVRAPQRPEYFPVYFIEPLQGNELALGYDRASEPVRREALRLALARGQAAATAPIRLLHGDDLGVVIFLPVYPKPAAASPHATTAIGLASAVLRLPTLVERAVQYRAPRDIDTYLFDPALPPGRQLLYRAAMPESVVGAPVEPDPTRLRHGLHHAATLEIAGREWLLVATPGVNYLNPLRTWLPWGTLITGLLFTALLAAYLHRYAQTTAALRAAHHESEQRVRYRTNALKPAIATLRAEIAQRRRIEKQLRKKEAIFRTFLNSTPAMMWMTNRDGHCIFFNNAWLGFIGQDLREALESVWMGEEIHPDDREACMATYWRGFRDHTAFQHQYRMRAKNGVYRWVFEIGTPFFDTAGRYEGFIGTASDVTERLEVERMKDEFLSIVSHELRTPLTSIRGALGLLATGALGRLNDKGGQMLAIAVSNTERLVRLINDTLDLERMESGRATLDVHLCDAGALIGQARDLLQPLTEKAGVTIVAACPSLKLRADPDRIVQVLTNLLSNAIKFSEPGASVCVSAEASSDSLVFRVQDQGRGIPADKLELIFERFQQVDASDSRQKGGTGLGLAICRRIVQQHGGRIWVASELGRGSAFCFAVPAAGTPVDTSAGAQAPVSGPALAQTKAA